MTLCYSLEWRLNLVEEKLSPPAITGAAELYLSHFDTLSVTILSLFFTLA